MGMSLEEAIEHAERVAKDKYENANFMANNPWGDKNKIQGCIDCADEHRQLAKWLHELAERRKQPEIIRCKDCRYYSIRHELCKVNLSKPKNRYICHMPQNGFCSKAKRRTDG